MGKKRGRKISKSARIAAGLAAALCLVLLVFALQKPIPHFAADLRFPLGEGLTLSDVVTGVKNGSLAEPDLAIDASREGESTLSFVMKNHLGIRRKGEVIIEFFVPEKPEKPLEAPVLPPVVTGPEEISITAGEAFDLPAKFMATDSKGAALGVTIVGDYDLTKEGVYSLTAQATDEDGRTGSFSFRLEVKKASTGTTQKPASGTSVTNGVWPDGEYQTSTGKTLIVRGGVATIDGIIIANKTYALPKTYTSSYLTSETEQAYYRMRNGAAEAGFTLTIRSAYRSWNDQNYIFNNYVRDDGLENALTYSARPGHSEHQTGLAMDLVTSSSQEAQSPSIKPILDWLKENAWRYGFIYRYPEGKSHITGYIAEPWHYRYVGEELAKNLYNDGNWITLEEYFGIDSVYRGYN